MKTVRWVLCFAGICTVAFAAGIITGFIKNGVEDINEETNEEIAEEAQIVIMEEETLVYKPKKLTHYLVMSEGEYIELSEVFDDESENVIEVAEFNPSVLPMGDIELLKEGIIFTDKDEALLMIENFVS